MGCCCGILEDRVNERFNENQIIAKETFWANLQYQRSIGCCQIQGNGALVLTSDMLWFNLLCPDKQIVMPLRSILAVGLDVGRLIVDFVDPSSGIEDQVIFALREPRPWKNLIEVTKGGYFGEWKRLVSERFVKSRIIAKEIFGANLQFQRSLDYQLQGNGALVLTPDMLWFSLLLPDKQIEMPLQNIRAVEAHNRQRRRPPLLAVTFVDAAAANEDQVIFALKDPQSWKKIIDETIQGGQNLL